MSKPVAVKLSESFAATARAESEVMCRSLSAQVEYWARLGMEAEAQGALTPAKIRELLIGKGSVQDLEGADDTLYVDALTKRLERLDGSDTRLLDELRAGGYSVASTDNAGKLIIEKPGGSTSRPHRRSRR